VQSWNINSVEVPPSKPVVLDTQMEGRAILIQLPAGEKLGEHQVHERAWLMVAAGEIEISEPGGDSARGGAGMLTIFDPNERHEITATSDARLLLLLSPWPGEGHPRQASSA
jgi:quercetin dioxygenase-like cupin family protein